MKKIIHEVTPLSDSDCFYMKDRYKDYFNAPMHYHTELELNFVENCEGAMRIVGNTMEETGVVDLTLTDAGVAHTWTQHRCRTSHIREITFQFNTRAFNSLNSKTAFEPINRMIDKLKGGCLVFDIKTAMAVYSKLLELTVLQSGFYKMLKFMEVLYDLSESTGVRRIDPGVTSVDAIVDGAVDPAAAVTPQPLVPPTDAQGRIAAVSAFIRENFRREVYLAELAKIAGMSPTAFSRFFKAHTGKSVTDYIIEIRLSEAYHLLLDGRKPVAEICKDCGFNNVSNFNRIFKKKKGMTPNSFRHLYQHRKALV